MTCPVTDPTAASSVWESKCQQHKNNKCFRSSVSDSALAHPIYMNSLAFNALTWRMSHPSGVIWSLMVPALPSSMDSFTAAYILCSSERRGRGGPFTSLVCILLHQAYAARFSLQY